MNNPAFIVDGFTEKNIIHVLCPGTPVRRIDMNGRKVSLSAMAKKIAALIRLFNNRHYPIIILVDKEDRSISVDEMGDQIRQSILAEGIDNVDMRIGIADRMIENWILADWEKIAPMSQKPNSTDGINGCARIKELIGYYGKTTDGVELFLNAEPSTIYLNSPSFRFFLDQIKDIDCKYLKLLA